MKTLAVLSALVTITIAAPTLEEYTHRTSLSPDDFTITQQRDKKSVLETPTEKILEPTEDNVLAKTVNKFGPSGSGARTFSGFKKPIIVKKKIGYHVYRDSAEEQAQTDSRESCRKQIKVKLCDDNNSVDKMKSASIDHTHEDISEEEMKHSINMAKEAVETFQRDLQKMEHDSVENNEEKHTKLRADKELRDDIEKARQALEHIEKKFKSFESVTAIKDENIPNAHLKKIKSDEERMAQWKEVGKKIDNEEIGRNLEDNFKSTHENDVTKVTNVHKSKTNTLNDADIKSIATVEDVDARTSTDKETHIDEGIVAVIEDKKSNMKIHSDSLKKEKLVNEDIHKEDERNEMMKKTIDNDSPHHEHLELKERMDEHKKDKVQLLNLDLQEKHVTDDDNAKNNDKSKSSSDNSEPDNDDKQIKLKNELQSGQLRSMNENDQVLHETGQVATLLDTDNKKTLRSKDSELLNKELTTDNKQKLSKENLGHDGGEQRHSKSFSDSQKHTQDEHNLKEVPHQNDQHRLAQSQVTDSNKIKQENLLNVSGLQRSLESDMDIQKVANPKTTLRLDDEKTQFKNHLELQDNVNNDHEMPEHLRASSNFHKELLNNMDFTEDAHHTHLNKLSHTETNHMKNEKSKLQERFNVPRVQPNSEHLNTMMRLSDNSNPESLQRSHLKMASMMNNEQPNFNVQFNTPETFEQQTNVQDLMPFKAAEDFHKEQMHKSHLEDKEDTMHTMENIPSAVNDPLKIRWAHTNNINSDKLKGAHLEQENMKMDGSSQHFNIDKSMGGRTNFMDHHLDHNNHMHTHQRWAQGKMNPNLAVQNFQTNMQRADNSHSLHNHDAFVLRNDHNMMMQGKTNMDNSMQPFMHMRGAPKMSLEYSNANQWAHDHGAFRSSYGPASYGSGGGGSSSSGSSAVGVFPNANVGNCAVPLLLSCSPSVVSGSLAKANTFGSNSFGSNTYSAPSYRSEDMNFLTKRDTDKPIKGLKVQRHIPLSNNPNIILEKKQ